MILLVAFFVPALIFLIYGLPILKKEGISSVFGGPFSTKFYLPPKAQGEIFLQDNFTYYKTLSPKGKAKFFSRFGYLLHNKEITGAEGFEVTDEMRYYIVACWVQVTYGLQKYRMPNYEKIGLYESTFYSRRAQAEVKGLTTGNMLFFSWEDFVDGYKNPSDNYNVGIHELSHAFLVSTFKGGDFDIDFSSYIDQWFEATKVEFENLVEGIPSYLREYGGANNYEFFSVCMETFFENPQTLKEKLPDIFYHLCYLLNQNPLNTTGDYAFDNKVGVNVNTAIPLPDKAVRTLKYTGFHWSYFIPVASSLLVLLSYKVYIDTIITFPEFLLLFLAGLSIAAIKLIRKRIVNFFGPNLAALFMTTCFGFGVLNIVCLGNYYIPVSGTKTEEHFIVAYEHTSRLADKFHQHTTPVAIRIGRGRSKRVSQTRFTLENSAYDSYPNLRSIDGNYAIDDNHYVFRLKYHYGLFGLKVVEETKVVHKEIETK